MSGFFTKLLERVIPTTPAIEPRRASRFEDQRATAARTEFDPEISPELDVPPTIPRVQPRLPEAEFDVRPRPVQEPPAATRLAPHSTNRYMAGEERQPNQKRGTEILAKSDSTTVSPVIVRSEIATVREIHVPTVAPAAAAPLPLPSQRTSLSLDSWITTPTASQREIPPPTLSPSAPLPLPITPRISKPREETPAVGERMSPLNPPPPQAPPRIQVTIGSIEIRAAVAQSTGGVTRSFKEPQTPISLKDHLDQQKRRTG